MGPWTKSDLDGEQLKNAALSFESHCLRHELDCCVAAALEIPEVPISDGQVGRAQKKIAELLERAGINEPIHLRALYTGSEIYFFAEKNGRWSILWGMNGLPSLAQIR